MATIASSNYGSTFTFSGSAVGACVVIDFPELTTDKMETTNHAGGGVREWIPSGLIGLGDITLSVITAASVVSALKTYMQNKTVATAVVSNGVDTMTFSAFFTSIKPEAADATGPDANKLTVVLSPTGGLTLS
jgi:hypothetical protein